MYSNKAWVGVKNKLCVLVLVLEQSSSTQTKCAPAPASLPPSHLGHRRLASILANVEPGTVTTPAPPASPGQVNEGPLPLAEHAGGAQSDEPGVGVDSFNPSLNPSSGFASLNPVYDRGLRTGSRVGVGSPACFHWPVIQFGVACL